MKRAFVFLFLMGLIHAAAFATGSQAVTTQSGGAVTVKYHMPGEASTNNDAVMAVVNESLQKDKGIRLETVYIPWDAWWTRVNIMLSTQEEFDMFHVMQPNVPISSYQSMGGLADLTDLIDSNGPNLKKAVSQAAWDAMKINGRLYGIPAEWVNLAKSEGMITIRKDMMDKLGLEMPRTNADLLTLAEQAQAAWQGNGKLYLTLFSSQAANPLASHTTALHREYSSFPFNVMDSVIYVGGDGSVKSWIETGEFRKDAQWMRTAYQKGLLQPDLLTLQQEQGAPFIENGNWIYHFGSGGDLEKIRANNNPDATVDSLIAIKLYPDKPDFGYQAVKNCNAVSSTSKHPDAVIKFVDWLYTSQSNYNLFLYGRSGQDVVWVQNGKYREYPASTRNEQGAALYGQADWMIGNLNYIKQTADVFPYLEEWLYTPSQAMSFPGADLLFEPATVDAEWATVQNEFFSSVAPIYLGLQDYDQAFPAALRRMKAAGLDKVVAEYARQMKAHLGR